MLLSNRSKRLTERPSEDLSPLLAESTPPVGDGACGPGYEGLDVAGRAQPEGVVEVNRIAISEPVQVEPPGEPDGIFLRKTPDRREVVDLEQRR